MRNAGKYDKRVGIYKTIQTRDSAGFPEDSEELVMIVYAEVKTTKGFTLIANNTDLEKALTRFTIRYPGETAITYDMYVKYHGKKYSIEYINNIDEAYEELELQCKEVRQIGKF